MTNLNQEQDEKPEFRYWHVWTDEKGISRLTLARLSSFQLESMSSGAEPQWNNHLVSSEANIVFTQLPVGWVGEWHENPKPQWIIPLSGTWFVETMDGTRVEMGPGEVSFGGDQNTSKDAKGQQGHRSGTVGKEPVLLMLVQLKDLKWRQAKPEDFN